MKSYKISYNEKLGRHLIATKKIQPGTIILQEQPLVRGPFLHSYPVCLGCNQILTSDCYSCMKCGWPLCSSNCGKITNHSAECQLTQARGQKITIKNFGIPNPNYQFITILRTLNLKNNQPEIWNKIINLQAHPIETHLAPASFIKNLFKLNDWSEDEIEKVIQILTINGHELPLTHPSELALYDDTSFLEHNCKANCTKTFTNEGQVLIISAEEIQENQNLSICYTDPFWGIENRQQHLQQSKNFKCCCSRCQDPTEFQTHINSIQCPNSSCFGFVYPKTFLQEPKIWNCNSCDSLFSNETVTKLIDKIGIEITEIPKGDARICKQFLQKYQKILTPNHFYLIDIKTNLSYLLAAQNYEELTIEDLQLLLEMSQDLEFITRRIAVAERRFLGLILYRQAKTRIELARRSENLQEFPVVVEESKHLLIEAQALLGNEPTLLPEGRVCLQIELELQLIDNLLNRNFNK